MDKNQASKVSLVPVGCYAGVPYDGIGPEYDRNYCEMRMAKDVHQWKKGDWAVGVPMTADDKDVYKILKSYEDKIIGVNL